MKYIAFGMYMTHKPSCEWNFVRILPSANQYDKFIRTTQTDDPKYLTEGWCP